MNKLIPMPIILLLAAFLSGCDLVGDHAEWTAILPALPGPWRDTFPEAKADLILIDADGASTVSEVDLAAGRFSVNIKKESNSLVLLYPKPAGVRLRPYGAIFPASGDEAAETLSLTAAGGFAAERLAHLASLGFDITLFNSRRLLDFLAEKGGDPWDFDPILFETRMAAGDFSVYAVKKLETRSASLRLPAGVWFSESPAAPVWETDGSGPLVIPELAYGYHTLFRRGGTERVDVSVSEKEVIVFGP